MTDHEPDDPGKLVDLFLEGQVPHPSSFERAIDDEDEMLLHALRGYRGDRNRAVITYLVQGRQLLKELEQIAAWHFGADWSAASRVLDFASGFGRFTRFLVQEVHPTRVWSSDLYTDALEFQRLRFGVNAVPSASSPDDLQLAGPFDLIFVSSLFSHLPERTFSGWLRKLVSLLAPRGLLLFSTHGIGASAWPAADFVFQPESESRSLSADDYGTAFVAEAFVARILRATEPAVAWRFFPHGHLGFQDLYVVCRDPGVDLRLLPYEIGCFGHVAGGWLDASGMFHLRGWAADLGGDDRSVTVRVASNGRTAVECQPTQERPDVADRYASPRGLRSGWTCAFRPGSESDWITVQVIGRTGGAQTISVATVGAMTRW